MDTLQPVGLLPVSVDSAAEPLTPDQVIARLTYIRLGSSPRAALEAAIIWREEITPRLLDEICLAPVDVEARYRGAPKGTVYFLHTISFLLLGYFRETRAFQLMLDYYMSDSDFAEELTGEAIGEYLPGVLVRCYDGSSLRQLRLAIETPAYDPLFRYECFRAYHGLVLNGAASRSDLVDVTARQLNIATDASFDPWYGWLALAAAELQEPALCLRLETLVERGLAKGEGSIAILGKSDIAKIYASRPESIAGLIKSTAFFDKFVDRICRWHWFENGADHRLDDEADSLDPVTTRLEPFMRQATVGRNDTCPCGSGKKYKNCCLN